MYLDSAVGKTRVPPPCNLVRDSVDTAPLCRATPPGKIIVVFELDADGPRILYLARIVQNDRQGIEAQADQKMAFTLDRAYPPKD